MRRPLVATLCATGGVRTGERVVAADFASRNASLSVRERERQRGTPAVSFTAKRPRTRYGRSPLDGARAFHLSMEREPFTLRWRASPFTFRWSASLLSFDEA